MKKFIHLIIVIFAVLLCLCSCGKTEESKSNPTQESSTQPPTVPEKFTTYVVTAESVNIREKADIESNILDKYYKNTVFLAYNTDSTFWSKVKLGESKVGYVHNDYISPISYEDYNTYLDYQISEKVSKHAMISETYANIRSLPTTDSESIATYSKYTIIDILATTVNGWYLIEHNELTCYVSPDVISILTDEEYQSYISTPSKSEGDLNLEIIGSYSTDYSFSNYNRKYNLEKAASEMNNLVIQPGGMFNWCRDIGACGQDEGYLESLEIQNGEYVTGYGGGICQLSSTLCASILNSQGDFEIVERNRHALEQAYIPSDLDATVSYPDCNFVFKNENSFDILIQTVFDGYTLTVNLCKCN